MSLENSPADSFFTNVSASNLSLSVHEEPTESFAMAIEHRFDSTAASPLAVSLPLSFKPSLSPPLSVSFLSPSTPSAPSASYAPLSSGHPNTSNTIIPLNFSARLPADLDSFIHDQSCLILDIRTHAAFTSASLPRALSLSVPSTLLKRPLFSLTKLSKMLPSNSARLRFSAWSSASSILVYDTESSSISEGSNIHGLLKKFRNGGFPPDKQLAWLKGGFASVWRERPDLVVSGPEHIDDDDEEGVQDIPCRLSLSGPSLVTEPPSSVLWTKNLPVSAFISTSTTSQLPASRYSPVRSISTYSPASSSSRPAPPHSTNLTHPTPVPIECSSLQPLAMAFNPFYDTVRQNIELSQGITERIPLTLPNHVRSRINDLPFPWLRHIARRAALTAKDYYPSSSESQKWSSTDDPFTPDRLSDTDPLSNEQQVEEGTEAFAMQFYRIELGEQRRLMGIMQHHSQESGHIIESPSSLSEGNENQAQSPKPRSTAPKMANKSHSTLFPYSITAGVEKGTKNRYRNIWPFEHARVRLHKHSLSDDDYINASFVQPLGTTKRYIATQGPLDATLNDFWTLVWEQNVHVIVMLTKEVEGMHVKCSNYWKSARYGPLILTLLESSESKEQEAQRLGQEAWGLGPSPSTYDTASLPPSIIKRKLQLQHTGYPGAVARFITQLQYLEWPDLNVPDDPRGILNLVREVGEEVGQAHIAASVNPRSPNELPNVIHQTTGIMKRTIGNPPVLFHCSAGVGRTGAFIAVDAVLDGVRREIRKQYDQLSKRTSAPPSTSLSTQNHDDPMHQGPVASYDNDQSMEVDEDEKKKPFHSFSLENSFSLPTYTDGNGNLVADFPAVGWSHDYRERLCSDGFSEDVSEKGSVDSDISSQADFVPRTARQKALGLTQPHSRISPIRQFKEWLNSGITPGSAHMTSHSPSPDSSSFGDGALGSRSGSVSGSAPESGGSSQQNRLMKNGGPPRSTSPLSHTASSQSSFPPSSSPSTRSSSEAPELSSSACSLGSRARTSSVPTRSSLTGPTVLSIARSSSLGKQLHDRPIKIDHSHKFSSSRFSSPLSSSAQDSTGRSFSDSAPQAESTDISSVSLNDDIEKPILNSNMSLRSDSFESSTVSKEELPSRHQSHMSPAQTDSTSLQVPSTAAIVDNHATGFDYTDPRALHVDESPLLLSSFDEPVRRVVEDMREQRMSLCQSLRQYVFVHRAIIEGALMVVDEERARYQQKNRQTIFTDSSRTQQPGELTSSTPSPLASAPLNKGKRIASLTELLKVNTSGEVVLSKKHSAKRKQRSDEHLKDDMASAFNSLHPQFSHLSQRSPTSALPRSLA